MIVYLLRVQQWPALPHPPNHGSMKKSSWASPPWLGPGSFTLSVGRSSSGKHLHPWKPGVSLFLCRCSSKRKDWGVGRSRARPGSPLGFEGNSSAAVVVVTFHRNSRISAVRSAGRRGESGVGLQRAWAQRKVSGSCLYHPGSAIPRKGTLLSARG